MDIVTEAILNKLKDSLRSHRQVDAVRALRDLIGGGLSAYRDNYPDEHPNVPLKTCVDIVRAIDTLMPAYVPAPEENESNRYDPSTPDTEYVLCIWPGEAGVQAQSYRYFDYKEAMEDADRHLQDYGPNATISVSKVLAVSKVTRTMARV